MMDELWRMGAADLATAIAGKELTSSDVVDAHLARIEAVNPALNAVTVVLADEARAAAAEADRALQRGDAVGPLHGVPMSVKESIDVAGSATTQGIVALANTVPEVDAPHISQLRAAGAIPIARTNMPDFGLRVHTDNALHGATKNPWDPGRTPGGSSGGEAVALAAGMTPLGMGGDYAGSLRWPSQCCGTVALRPTLGRVSRASAPPTPEPPSTFQLFAVVGPMARHVRDLRLALGSMSGPDARDPWWTPAPLRNGQAVPVRVAVTADPAGEGVHPDVAAGVRRASAALADAGYTVEEVEPPQVAEARDLFQQLVITEVNAAYLPLLEQLASPDALRFVQLGVEAVPPLDLREYIAGFGTRFAIARAWAQFQEDWPLVLGPVCASQPFVLGYDLAGVSEAHAVLNALRLTTLANLLGLPSVALPVGEAGGLPQGVQIIGPRYREDLCLDAAEAIEERLGVITPIDPRTG